MTRARGRVFLAVASLLFVAVPAAAEHGRWLAGGGALEPSSAFDTRSVMFPWPNDRVDPITGAPVERVYFNGYFVAAPVPRIGVRLDANADGGRTYPAPAAVAVAILGYWRDCNGDGYVGAKVLPVAYGNLGAYPVAAGGVTFPIDRTLCPAGSPYWPTNPATGQPSALVDEFRWLGPGAGCDASEPGCPGNATPPPRACVPPASPTLCVDGVRAFTNGANDVSDAGARVWGDWERPGGPHVPYGPLSPLPRGTLSDSRGTLAFVDDATVNSLSHVVPGWGSIPNVGACEEPHPVFLGGPSGTCGLYPVHQARRLVSDQSCNRESSPGAAPGCASADPLVEAWDTRADDNGDGDACNDLADQPVPGPAGGAIARIALPDVRPRLNPNALADGSIAGTIGHAEGGLAGVAPGGDVVAHGCGDGDGIDDPLEIDAPDSMRRHVEPSFRLAFHPDARWNQFDAFGFYDLPVADVLGGPSGTGVNGLLVGTVGPSGAFFGSGPGWSSPLQWTPRPPRHGWGVVTPAFSTFYADVGEDTLSRNPLADARTAFPAGVRNAHVYGAESCRVITSGPSAIDPGTRWECSVTEWERVRAAVSSSYAVLGDPYDLRDVDCYDNEATHGNAIAGSAAAGIRLGLAVCP